MSPLVLGELLVLFANRLISDGKYPIHEVDNLQLPIHMQLSEKRKNFSGFFVPFVEFTSIFKHFEKKDDCHS